MIITIIASILGAIVGGLLAGSILTYRLNKAFEDIVFFTPDFEAEEEEKDSQS